MQVARRGGMPSSSVLCGRWVIVVLWPYAAGAGHQATGGCPAAHGSPGRPGLPGGSPRRSAGGAPGRGTRPCLQLCRLQLLLRHPARGLEQHLHAVCGPRAGAAAGRGEGSRATWSQVERALLIGRVCSALAKHSVWLPVVAGASRRLGLCRAVPGPGPAPLRPSTLPRGCPLQPISTGQCSLTLGGAPSCSLRESAYTPMGRPPAPASAIPCTAPSPRCPAQRQMPCIPCTAPILLSTPGSLCVLAPLRGALLQRPAPRARWPPATAPSSWRPSQCGGSSAAAGASLAGNLRRLRGAPLPAQALRAYNPRTGSCKGYQPAEGHSGEQQPLHGTCCATALSLLHRCAGTAAPDQYELHRGGASPPAR